MIINNECAVYYNNGAKRMNRPRAIELSLLALRAYDPGDYVAEINEIFSCIVENRKYDDEPTLSKEDLIGILESLTIESKHPLKYSLRNILSFEDKQEKRNALKKVQDILVKLVLYLKIIVNMNGLELKDLLHLEN